MRMSHEPEINGNDLAIVLSHWPITSNFPAGREICGPVEGWSLHLGRSRSGQCNGGNVAAMWLRSPTAWSMTEWWPHKLLLCMLAWNRPSHTNDWSWHAYYKVDQFLQAVATLSQGLLIGLRLSWNCAAVLDSFYPTLPFLSLSSRCQSWSMVWRSSLLSPTLSLLIFPRHFPK